MEEIDLRLGDCLDVMQSIPDKSIDLTVTSPPYDNLRTYKGYSFYFEGIAKELYRVTKDGGVVVWVVGDATINGSETGTSFKQALYFKEIGFNLHDTMIWKKSNPTPTDPRVGRYTPSFEYMFIFSKSKLKKHNLQKIKCKNAGLIYNNSSQLKKDGTARTDRIEKRTKQTVKEYKILDNVWDLPILRKNYGHPAAFPEIIAEKHILSWSNEGDTVLDCFLGSGTTGKIAKQLNRKFIGIEISQEYLEIAKKRIYG